MCRTFGRDDLTFGMTLLGDLSGRAALCVSVVSSYKSFDAECGLVPGQQRKLRPLFLDVGPANECMEVTNRRSCPSPFTRCQEGGPR